MQLLAHLIQSGLAAADARLTPLPGGVSSDISLVESSSGTLVVKAALEKLRVKDDWFADVSRNRVEQDFFDYAAPIIPAHVPGILGRGDGWFAMEYLGELPNWKTKLITGEADENTAKLAGDVLGRLHAASWLDNAARARFNTLPNFHALRIEPYLLKTAERVPEVAPILRAEAARLAETQLALVHGDYSPKNLLVGPQRLIVLDAECAWFGDPVFDTAFMLTHLHLKALLHPHAISLVPAFWSAYLNAFETSRERPGVCRSSGAFERPLDCEKLQRAGALQDAVALEERTVKLLLCLLLARVHGKSPVEYLSEPQKARVTRFVLTHLPHPPSLAALTASWI
ncbi:MAG: aminoglycoside phosphotransferase family protein [Prosthecobacter sp.]|jgi:aminoglycoside phosphotransferase (APT) family kinase protein|uniref:phosphotransferase family protein n=1 Tax=Prosthecobacter sp. TaxID=1965333 RepID=UPI0019FC515A|nr:aminoglycoside phosphotransferase family protein [Prosthecobacter sp.]MBE2287122.1 aminoglycoside phosphotransferase family protein [Prosthecobacter sp.]